jgi:hypothetical protein
VNKHALRALLQRQRGIHALPVPLRHVEGMDEREAGQWLRLLRNMVEDAERHGAHKAAQKPHRIW